LKNFVIEVRLELNVSYSRQTPKMQRNTFCGTRLMAKKDKDSLKPILQKHYVRI